MENIISSSKEESSPSARRILTALAHRQPDRVPVDLGSTLVSGLHVSCVAALRRHYGLDTGPVQVIDPGQMLGAVEDDLKRILKIDTEGIFRRMTRFGFPAENWKGWRMEDGLEVLVPERFNVTRNSDGDTLIHPGGDLSVPPSAKMPRGGHFFDAIIRQPDFREEELDPADNLEEYTQISEPELAHLERNAKAAAATGRAVVASFGGTAFGDIANIPGTGLKYPKGIRGITEWYIATHTRRDYIHKVFEGQCDVGIANLVKIAARVKDYVNVVNICGTDFGTQGSSFCSVKTFRELWMPYYKRVNDWVHQNTHWKTFKHSCGAVEKFIDSFVESGFDILNPVQCSALGMDAEELKSKYGGKMVLWGGGIDTQQVLPFGTPQQVREQVLRRCEIFSPHGGFVFNAIHNIQAKTPVENIIALFEAVSEFNG